VYERRRPDIASKVSYFPSGLLRQEEVKKVSEMEWLTLGEVGAAENKGKIWFGGGENTPFLHPRAAAAAAPGNH